MDTNWLRYRYALKPNPVVFCLMLKDSCLFVPIRGSTQIS